MDRTPARTTAAAVKAPAVLLAAAFAAVFGPEILVFAGWSAPAPFAAAASFAAMAFALAAFIPLARRLREALRSADLLERESAGLRAALAEAEEKGRNAAERERVLQTTFDSMQHGILIRDASGAILASNRRLLEMFDLSPEDVRRGRDIGDLIRAMAARGEYGPQPDADAVARRRLAAPGDRVQYVAERVRPNGRVVELRVGSTPDGGRVSTYADVTERRRAEEALKESEERYRALANVAQVGILHQRPDGATIYANPAMLELLEVDSIAAIDAVGVRQFYTPESWARIQEQMLRRRRGEASSYEVEMLGAKGARRTVVVRGAPLLDAEGRLNSTMGVYADVTEERARAEQLRQAQKLEVIGQLTGGIAHDFNNLLAVILGNLELLNDQQPAPEAAKLIAASLRAGRRGSELVQRLLSFARRQPLEPRPVDVPALVEGMVELLRRLLGETIRIERSNQAGVPPALVDPAQLESAVVNLAVNARDAMAEGGVLRISVREVDGLVAVEMRDDGCGMSPEILERVFEPFFTTKRVGKGSGLGLSMVYGFVEQSGGRIDVESAPGEGTSIRLLLPAAPGTWEGVQARKSGAPPRGAGQLVLLVEDDPDVRELAAAMLGNLGYRVTEAADGAQALAALERNPDVSLLLTDVMLPNGLRGTALARTALERRPDLAAVCMSGYDGGSAPPPGVDVLLKPFHKEELATALRDALARKAGSAAAG